jgi:cbb3-type cytochrome oxidase subunit 3
VYLVQIERSWANIVTVSCIIVIAVIEAWQQALSGAPQVAAILPSLDGMWHFVPLGLLIIAGVSWLVGRRAKPENQEAERTILFENRDDLNRKRGGLSKELEFLKKGWVVWPAAGSAIPLSDERLKNIDRLILLNPNEQVVEYAETFKARGRDIVANAIRDLTQRAQGLQIPVRWYTYPYASIVIHDHVSDGAWARIELLLPGIESAHRPSIIIKKSVHPLLFGRLVEMYEYMWAKSNGPG